jgi:hypothetical protein
MTTSTTTPRLNYTADGSTAAFTFNFEIADSSSIAVYVGSTLKTLTSEYTVSFDSGTSGTGTVTFTSAPSSGTVTLIRDTNLARTTDFENSGAFLASTVNTEFDRLSQAVIDATDKIEKRAILLAEPNTETTTLTLPDAATRANKTLTFDGAGDLAVTSAGAGTVTNIATGTGLTGGPITTTGTIAIDSTVATLTDSQTLTNKTLTAPVISTISNTGTLTLPTSSDTLVGRATTDTLTNKTINTASNTITVNEADISDLQSYITASSTDTLTNKTFDANGTGNSISNIDFADLSASAVADEDDMISDSQFKLATQQSIKAYVDDLIATVSTGTISQNNSSISIADTGSNGQFTVITDGNTELTVTDAGVRVHGDLTVDGSTVTMNTTNLSVEDSFIELNRNNSSTATDVDSGIFIRNGYTTGSKNNPVFYWDHGQQKFLFIHTDVDPNTSPASLYDGVSTTLASIQAGNIVASGSVKGSAGSEFYDVKFKSTNTGTSVLEIDENTIRGLRSNDDITIDPAGTGQVSANSILNVNSNRIINVGTPTTGTDAANQDYVDTQVADKNSIAQLDTNVTAADTGAGGTITVTADNNTIFTASDSSGLTMSKNIAMGGNQITGLDVTGFPSADSDVSTKKYVDDSVGALGSVLTDVVSDTTPQLGGNLDLNSNDITGTGNITITGTHTVTGQADIDFVTIKDNEITTNASNANLRVSANGTGKISTGPQDFFESNDLYTGYAGSTDMVKVAGYRLDSTVDANTTDRVYGVAVNQNTTLSGGSSSNNNFRPRTFITQNSVDMAGSSYTVSGESRGPTALNPWTNITNTSSTASTLNSIHGTSSWAASYANTANDAAGDLTVSNAVAVSGNIEVYSGAGTGNFTYTNAYNFKSNTFIYGSNDTITNLYGFYHADTSGQSGTITNEYAFYDASNSLSVFGDIQTQAVSITDNVITTNRSNDDLNIQANGTGQVVVSANGGDFATFSTQSRYDNGNIMYYEDLAHTLNVDRAYGNSIVSNFKATTGQTSTSNDDRFRNFHMMRYDLNGSSSTATSTYLSRGPIAVSSEVNVINSSSSNGSLGNATGLQGGVWIQTTNTGDLTMSGANSGLAGVSSWIDLESATGSTITVDNAYAFYSSGTDSYGSGTVTLTDFYHYYARTNGVNPAGENYAFYSADDTAKSRVGTLQRYREEINALTSSSTITVDCGLAPVHTVTLAANTEFNIANLGTGQTVTLIITQDGTGNRTATFGTDTSTAVKFPGGVPSLSTGGGDIDIVTIFNDGTNHLGNIQKDYS